ncbi:MAG: hypothetical protein E6327_14670 [Klebsiella variicola]|nr:hypothetical protein [Klebsiella variicola]
MKLMTRIAFAALLTTGFSLIKDGALINVIDSGKWDEKAVKDQLAAFSKIDQQVRYYRVKYYFDVNQVLTPEQRTQVKKDLADALSE